MLTIIESDTKFRHIMRPLPLNLNAVQITVVADAVVFGPATVERIMASVEKQPANKEAIADAPWFVDMLAEENKR